jgi:hypothetical protein
MNSNSEETDPEKRKFEPITSASPNSRRRKEDEE